MQALNGLRDESITKLNFLLGEFQRDKVKAMFQKPSLFWLADVDFS